MAVDWNAAIDDDGSGTTGTIIDKAEFSALLRGTVVPDTNVSTVHNWPPTLTPGRTLITWFGASDFTCTGLANGSAGQVVTIKNTGTAVAYFVSGSASSAAVNRFVNVASSAPTPVAPGGWVTYQHTGTNWHLIGHQQGNWITPAYAGGNFTGTGGTWTVEVGDLGTYNFALSGKTLTVAVYITASSVGGTPTGLNIQIPGGFLASRNTVCPVVFAPNGVNEVTFVTTSAASPQLSVSRITGAFVTTTNTTYGYFVVSFEVN